MTITDTRVAPPLRPPRAGLLTSVPTSSSVDGYDGGQARWGHGLDWLAEMPPWIGGQVGARALGCASPDSIDYQDFAHPPTEKADPFSVYAVDWCSALGFFGRDWEGRARRALEATQSFLIAQEFWLGTIAQAQANDNVWLADATSADVVTAPTAVQKAIAGLDNFAADRLRNGQAYLHMTPQVLDLAMAADAVYRDGDRWRTAWGSIVVADGGYTGTLDGQGDDGDWIVATGPVEVVLGPIRVPDLTTAEGRQYVVERTVNDVAIWAERDVIVLWEPQVLHAAVQVDLT